MVAGLSLAAGRIIAPDSLEGLDVGDKSPQNRPAKAILRAGERRMGEVIWPRQ